MPFEVFKLKDVKNSYCQTYENIEQIEYINYA